MLHRKVAIGSIQAVAGYRWVFLLFVVSFCSKRQLLSDTRGQTTIHSFIHSFPLRYVSMSGSWFHVCQGKHMLTLTLRVGISHILGKIVCGNGSVNWGKM